jgi:NAD(P)-dependent dehydrogenase (short-subunit alcohol dehydrogenase family)
MVDEAFRGEEVMKATLNAQPLGRLGQSIDIAYYVLYLASDESWFTTGTTQNIDGGLSVTGGVRPVVEQ